MRAVSNVVFMGMGEPLYNLDNVADAIAVLTDGDGLSLSKRRITVSTSGVVPEMAKLGERCGTLLAVSLHATNDALRDKLVPLNKRYPIKDLMQACRDYPGASNARRVTFEYVMLKGVNDSPAEARALVKLLKGLPAKINLIPFNPWPGSALRMLGLGDHRAIFRDRVQRRLCEPGAHAARPRHPGRLRPTEERNRKAARPRPPHVGRKSRRCPGLIESNARAPWPAGVSQRSMFSAPVARKGVMSDAPESASYPIGVGGMLRQSLARSSLRRALESAGGS